MSGCVEDCEQQATGITAYCKDHQYAVPIVLPWQRTWYRIPETW